jgi:uncharacterized membrane protein
MAYFIIPATADAPSSTSISVEVLANGDAHWATTKKIPLTTPEEVAGWDATAKAGTDSYKVQFETSMKDYVNKISSAVGRPMLVQDVTVAIDRSSPYDATADSNITYGVIRYDFNWTGFAMARGDSLDIGDAFIDGFILNRDDTIDFILPHGYTITSVSPAYDDIKQTYQPQVLWAGRSQNNTDGGVRLFSSGEPAITMRMVAPPPFSLDWWMFLPVALLSAIIGFGAACVVLGRQKKRSMPPGVLEVPGSIIAPDAGTVEPEAIKPDLKEGRYMSDEARVIMYLEEAGGQMFQSDLVKKTDFSKSKLSMVLSELKEKGTIIKIKKGKENLIRLNRSPQDAELSNGDGLD